MNNLSVKNFTNIDEEDFEGMYGGQPISLRRGQTKAFTERIAKHLAGQLVHKILTRKGKDYLLDPEREGLITQMLGEVTALAEEPVKFGEVDTTAIEEKVEEFADLEVKKKRGRPSKNRK